MKLKALNAIDWYKVAHRAQYPQGTEVIFSNFTPRSAKYFKQGLPKNTKYDDKIVVFGLQGFIKWYLIDLWNETFFKQPLEKVLNDYQRRVELSLGEGVITFDHIEELHKLGYLPIEIKALPEGTRSPIGVPVYTIHNTHPDFFWLTNYLESVMSSETWKPMTVATIAYEYSRLCNEYAELTCDSNNHVPFQCHDFSFRGMSGIFDTAQCGAGHLLSFMGTDSVLAIDYAYDYYGAVGVISSSISASEHSTATTNINLIAKDTSEEERLKAESQFFKRYITEIYPSGFCAYVADSYDYWGFLTTILPEHKDTILARDGKLVVRPDSGVPEDIICGNLQVIPYVEDWHENVVDYAEHFIHDLVWGRLNEECDVTCGGDLETTEIFEFKGKVYIAYYGAFYNRHDKTYYYLDELDLVKVEPYKLTPENKGSIEVLWDIFGGTINSKGYKVLNPKVGLIYGDSITLQRLEEIFRRLESKGFSSENIVAGVGSYSYNYITRDTFGFAVKATGAIVNGDEVLVYKQPKTDSGKNSAKGFLAIVKDPVNGELTCKDRLSFSEINRESNELKTVFMNGDLIKNEIFNDIRMRLHNKKD